MLARTSLSLALAVATLAACGAPALHPIDARASVVHDDTTSVTESAIPLSLSCVSAPVDQSDTPVPQVVRALIQETDEVRGHRIFSATVTQGAQFASHNGVFVDVNTATSSSQSDIVSARSDASGLHFASTGKFAVGLAIDVARASSGATFAGTLSDADHTGLALTCFSATDLFGDYGSRARLPAHFDWTLESCVDAKGAPALNHLPIEVVRESGWGECADLRGLSLNGSDFNMPDLNMTLWGANLDHASLMQASLNGSFEGARLADLDFGYATVNGTVDDATTLPSGDGCTVTQSPYGGSLLACSR